MPLLIYLARIIFLHLALQSLEPLLRRVFRVYILTYL